jgi:hypothetical protein
MPRTFNVNFYLLVIRRIGTVKWEEQFGAAIAFYGQFQIEVEFQQYPSFQLDVGERPFFANQDWTKIAPKCSPSQKGCDLFIVPRMERIEGHEPFGLTILPGKEPPEGIPKSATSILPEPNPARPAVILNASNPGAVPRLTLTHEFGHALLNSLKHHGDSENLMYEFPPGSKLEPLQIARLHESLLLE